MVSPAMVAGDWIRRVPRRKGRQVMSYVYNQEHVIVALNHDEAQQLQELLNNHPTLMEDYPAIWSLDLGVGA